MSDFVALASQAFAGVRDWPAARRTAAYAAAQQTFVAELHSAQPPLSAYEIAERAGAFADAIQRFETTLHCQPAPAPEPQQPEAEIPKAATPVEVPTPARRLFRLLGGGDGGQPARRALHLPARHGAMAAAAQAVPAPETETHAGAIGVVLSVVSPLPAEPQPDDAAQAAVHEQPITNTQPQANEDPPLSRIDEINRSLRKLQSDTPGIEGAALISEDGLMIASSLTGELDEARVAGMTATLLNLGGRATVELSRGAMQEVIVRGDHGYAAVLAAGRGALLLAITNETSKLGLVFYDMRETIKTLQRVL